MKIITSLFAFAAMALMPLPGWALRGIKEGGGDDNVILRCQVLNKAALEIIGFSYDNSEFIELQVFANKKLKTTDYGIWDPASASFSGYRFELRLLENELLIKNGSTLVGQTTFKDLTCERAPL